MGSTHCSASVQQVSDEAVNVCARAGPVLRRQAPDSQRQTRHSAPDEGLLLLTAAMKSCLMPFSSRDWGMLRRLSRVRETEKLGLRSLRFFSSAARLRLPRSPTESASQAGEPSSMAPSLACTQPQEQSQVMAVLSRLPQSCRQALPGIRSSAAWAPSLHTAYKRSQEGLLSAHAPDPKTGDLPGRSKAKGGPFLACTACLRQTPRPVVACGVAPSCYLCGKAERGMVLDCKAGHALLHPAAMLDRTSAC